MCFWWLQYSFFLLVPSSYEVSDLPGTVLKAEESVLKAEVNIEVKLVTFGANIKLSFSLFRLISFYVKMFFLKAYICITYHMQAWHPRRTGVGVISNGTGVAVGSVPSCICWDLILRHLKEH